MGVDVVADEEVGLFAVGRELLAEGDAEELAQDGNALGLGGRRA
jgi:hypothetical protein